MNTNKALSVFTLFIWIELPLNTLIVKTIVASSNLGLQDILLGFNQTFLTQCQANADCHCVGHPPGDCVADCNDCTGYYICYLDHYEHKSCPIGEIYYPATQNCAPGKCPRTDCHVASNSLGSQQILLGYNQTFLKQCQADVNCHCVGHPPGDCVADCTDCTGYYVCYLDQYEHRNCPSGQIYYPATQSCAPGKCPRPDCQTPIPPPSPTTLPPPTPPPPPPPPPECPVEMPICQYDGQILPDPQHCSYFWTCQHGCAVLSFCYPGMWYDPVRKVCDYRQNVVTCIANRD